MTARGLDKVIAKLESGNDHLGLEIKASREDLASKIDAASDSLMSSFEHKLDKIEQRLEQLSEAYTNERASLEVTQRRNMTYVGIEIKTSQDMDEMCDTATALARRAVDRLRAGVKASRATAQLPSVSEDSDGISANPSSLPTSPGQLSDMNSEPWSPGSPVNEDFKVFNIVRKPLPTEADTGADQPASVFSREPSMLVSRTRSASSNILTQSASPLIAEYGEQPLSADEFEVVMANLITTAEANKRRDRPFTDADFDNIARLLSRVGKPSWGQIPRTYLVLRLIDETSLMDDFVLNGVKDINFPYSLDKLPEFVIGRGPGVAQNFVAKQALVLSPKTKDLTRGGKHRHIGRTPNP